MLSYCVRCKRKTSEVNPTAVKTKNNRIAMECVCPVCGAKKSRFISMNEDKKGRFLGYAGTGLRLPGTVGGGGKKNKK